MVLAKHEPIVGGKGRAVGRQMLQPLQMGRAPVGSLAKYKAAPREELQDVVARFEDLALEGLPAAHHVADALFGFSGNADGDELAGAIQASEIGRVAFVMLPLHPRSF